MLFVKNVKPVIAGTALIAAIAPKDLNISDPSRYHCSQPPALATAD